jgi:hypothetical protein
MGRLTDARSSADRVYVYGYDLAGNRVLLQQGNSATGVDDGDGETLADVNRDGSVTQGDLAILRGAYGAETASSCFVAAADLNGSGRVDLVDLLLWYRGYPQGSWLPGDWTGAPASPTAVWSSIAPDGRVDFFDLAALCREWGRVTDGRPAARWLDLAPSTRDGRIDASELAIFQTYWLTGEGVVRAVAPSGGCTPTGQEVAHALTDATLEIRSRDGGAVNGKPVVVDVVLNGPVSDVACFQFLLDAEIDLGLDEVGGAPTGAAPLVWLGGDPQDQAVHFLDVRPLEGGFLVTGAFLDLAPTSTPGARVLCSIAVPRIEDERRFTVRQALCSAGSGAVYQVSEWSGMVSLNPVPPVPVLLQNRPNPFNPLTTLKYAVPAAAQVRLRVYDLQGRLVSVLVNQVQERGWHESRWDGRTGDGRPVASGLYFYKLQVGKETLTRKMSLIR